MQRKGREMRRWRMRQERHVGERNMERKNTERKTGEIERKKRWSVRRKWGRQMSDGGRK